MKLAIPPAAPPALTLPKSEYDAMRQAIAARTRGGAALIEALFDLALDPKVPAASRIAAARYLCDRFWGRVPPARRVRKRRA